jgi:hypothetical protein
MITSHHHRLAGVRINRRQKDKTRFRFRLEFRGIERPDAVEFEIGAGDLMILMRGLQDLQARYGLPIPARVRTKGKPSLRVVRSEDES